MNQTIARFLFKNQAKFELEFYLDFIKTSLTWVFEGGGV
jgi:hypothetical protein